VKSLKAGKPGSWDAGMLGGCEAKKALSRKVEEAARPVSLDFREDRRLKA
jgi:hypothetical protein